MFLPGARISHVYSIPQMGGEKVDASAYLDVGSAKKDITALLL